jgi:hypothetical protein
MKVYVHRRQPTQMTAWFNDAGFTVETHRTLTSGESTLGGILLAAAGTPPEHRRPASSGPSA